MLTKNKLQKLQISVIGLGYVGLPLAISLSKYFLTKGFDIDKFKIDNLKKNIDINKQFSKLELRKSKILYSTNIYDFKNTDIFIITVPTPINKKKLPDLSNLRDATKLVSKVLNKNNIVVYESTVYPGCTEEFCGNLIEKITKFKSGKDFYLGYSPERINPGDQVNTLETIDKLVSSQNAKITNLLKRVYEKIIQKVHSVDSIKIAEAAKVIENTQRDLNIALINEFNMIFSKSNLDTYKILKAASTKWNFLNFTPGLVGGHCIGIDPYYLAYFSKKIGINPQLILSGRQINENMSKFVAKRVLSKFRKSKLNILILGLTFKENNNDTRNSKVLDLIDFLKQDKHQISVYDPYTNFNSLKIQKINILKRLNFSGQKYDLVMIMVPHSDFKKINHNKFKLMIKENGYIFDFKNILPYDEKILKP